MFARKDCHFNSPPCAIYINMQKVEVLSHQRTTPEREQSMERKFLENLTCASPTLEFEKLYLVLTWKLRRQEAGWHCLWRQCKDRATSTFRFSREACWVFCWEPEQTWRKVRVSTLWRVPRQKPTLYQEGPRRDSSSGSRSEGASKCPGRDCRSQERN